MTNKGGRPTKYDPKYCDMLIEHMREGGSIVEFCAEIDIAKPTFYEWEKKYKEFSNSKRIGENLSQAWWMREARTSLRDRDFNSSLWYMNMKNRFNWSDRQQVDHTSKGNKVQSVNVAIIDNNDGNDQSE